MSVGPKADADCHRTPEALVSSTKLLRCPAISVIAAVSVDTTCRFSARMQIVSDDGKKKMIPILRSTAWREFRGEPQQIGQNRTTHLAMIEDPSGNWHRCYVKCCPPNWPTPLTEALAWLLAEALDLPRPEFAALVMVPLDKLRQHIPMDQHWLNYSEMIAFCVSAVDGKSAAHGWKWLAYLRAKRVYKRPEIARIAAFDHWVGQA